MHNVAVKKFFYYLVQTCNNPIITVILQFLYSLMYQHL